jgi:hypothetical protein
MLKCDLTHGELGLPKAAPGPMDMRWHQPGRRGQQFFGIAHYREISAAMLAHLGVSASLGCRR